jgi:protein-S-isoprenylcysteine O-methyltransferase Ste14
MSDKDGEHPFGHAGQLLTFIAFIIVWVADSFLLHLSTFPARYVPLLVRLAVLAALLVLAYFLSKSGHEAGGHDRPKDHIIETGAFRYVRHPMYLGIQLVYIGLAVATGSLLALAVYVGIFFFFNFIASYEERLLEEKFGDTYKNYKARTGKWLPRLGKRLE